MKHVSKSKQTEKTQSLSDNAYRSIFDLVYDAIWIHDIETKEFVDANEGVLRLFGYSIEEIKKLNVGDISSGIPPFTQETAAELMKQAVTGPLPPFEWHCRHKDGHLFWTEVQLTRGIIAGKECILAIERDITPRKLAEEALLETKQKLADTIEFLPDATLVIDKDGTVTAWNLAMEKMTGVKASEILGKGDYEYALPFYGERRPVLIDLALHYEPDVGKKYTSIKKIGEILFGEAYTPKLPSGVLFLSATATALRDSKGHIVGAIECIRDITDKKMAEEEKEKLHQQLMQAQKMESIGRLAGGVAHDFNNMLAVILSRAEMALERADPALPIYKDLVEIQKAAERSSDITRQLLAFARKQTVTPEVIDLNDSVDGMLNMLRRLIGEDIELIWKPGGKLWPVRIDPSQIDQIMANLCVNARDAIENVGKITIETGNVTVDEAYGAQLSEVIPGEYVILTVSDNGCGMDKAILSKIFEPFFTTKELGKGTGLGLAMVYGIIKQNNGYINVYSEPGRETTFKIYLPRYSDGIARRRRKADAAKPAARGTETILLVEDEPSILEVTTEILQRHGYKVLVARIPSEAVRLAAKRCNGIQMLITDVIMPEMNGPDLDEKIRKFCPDLKCLFMSGHPADVIAHHGVLGAGVHFIQKPFSMKDLTLKVRQVLDER